MVSIHRSNGCGVIRSKWRIEKTARRSINGIGGSVYQRNIGNLVA